MSASRSARCRRCCTTSSCAERSAGRCGHPWQDDDDLDAGVDLSCRRPQPSFLIGGIAENFGISFALGEGKHFILEGDEYDTAFFDKGPKFLHYFPDAVILTSVEFDHADIYKDLDAVETAFKRLVNLVPRRGRIIAFDTGESVGACLAKASARSSDTERSKTSDVADRESQARSRRERVVDSATMAIPGPISSFRWRASTTCWNATAAAALASALRHFAKTRLRRR